MHDDPRDAELEHDADLAEDLDAQALIAAAVAEARRYVRRNELRTNSALDAISDWIEKSEMRHADEAKRLSSSQERVASAMRDALDLMTGTAQPHRKARRGSARESLRADSRRARPPRRAHRRHGKPAQRRGAQFAGNLLAPRTFLASRVFVAHGKPWPAGGRRRREDRRACRRSRRNPKIREERIASIEAKLGSILQQLSRPTATGERSASPSARGPRRRPRQAPPPERKWP